MQQTIKALATSHNSGAHKRIASNYPFLSRGVDIEHQTLQDIDHIQKHLISEGYNIPAKTLRNAIFLPRDMEAEGRKYPKIIDFLMSSSFYEKNKRKSASQSTTSRRPKKQVKEQD